jgi:hypothetical protein
VAPVGSGPGRCDYLLPRAYRLTPSQIRRSYTALLGGLAPGQDFEAALLGSVPDARPFANSEQVLALSPGFAETMFNAARTVAVAAAGSPAMLNPCFGGGVTRACVGTFLADFGARAWRRPWTAEETTSYLAFFDAITTRSDARRGLEHVLRRLLVAPDVLFRFELGGAPDARGLASLAPFEMASALAYTLTDAPPDALLQAAARGNGLQTKAAVEAEARRLIGDPATAPNLLAFFDELMDGETVTAVPEQVEELRRFASHVLWKDGGKLATLMTAPYAFVNPALQKHYRWTALPPVRDWQQVTPPAAEGRAGLLTQGAFLGRKTNRSARGKFIRQAFLCNVVPEPPPDVDFNLDAQKASLGTQLGRPATEDEARQAHMNNPSCAGCHRLIDPIGLPLVAFDRLGLHQATNPETRRPFVTQSTIADTAAIDGPVADAAALAARLAAAPAVGQCMSRHAYEYLLGRAATENEACHLKELAAAFTSPGRGGDVKELFVNVLASDAFRLRAVPRN